MSWGNELNNLTGANSAMKTQYKYNLRLQKQNQQWQTEMANTAHQREIADLEAAGLNPVLSAGGSGAGTGAPGGGGVSGGGSDPAGMIATLANAYSTMKQTKNNTAKTNADIENETKITNAEVKNINANTRKTNQNYNIDQPDTIVSEIDEALKNGGPIGRFIYNFGRSLKWGANKLGLSGRDIAQAAAASRVANSISKPKTSVKNHYNSKGKLTSSSTTTTR